MQATQKPKSSENAKPSKAKPLHQVGLSNTNTTSPASDNIQHAGN